MSGASGFQNASGASAAGRSAPAGKKVLLEWNREEVSRDDSAPDATPQQVGYQPDTAERRVLHDAPISKGVLR